MKLLLALLTLYTVGLAAWAQQATTELPEISAEQAGLSAEKLLAIDAAIEKRIADGEVAGVVVMITRQGKVVYHKPFGLADRERNVPMRKDTIFRIYSMSKAITTTAAMMCWEAGNFKLDDPVSTYIPSFASLKLEGEKSPQRAMTVRDIMRHTSGLTYGWGQGPVHAAYKEADLFNKESDLEDMIKKLGDIPLLHAPGSEWHYSVSIDVLGHLVSVWSGMPFEKFLQERILVPLHMRDTGFHVRDGEHHRLAATYTTDLKVHDDPTKSRYLKPTRMASGGGGLVSTARDYMRFLCMLQGGGELQGTRLLQAETVATMTRNHLPADLMPIRFGNQMRWGVGHGLGFNVRTERNDRWDPPGRRGEYGWGGMASTHYWVSPADALCVVTLEQFVPYNFGTEWAIKNLIYDALQ